MTTDPAALGDPVEAWKRRGRELNAIYDALQTGVHFEESSGDAATDIRHLAAERDRLRAENERLREALLQIRGHIKDVQAFSDLSYSGHKMERWISGAIDENGERRA